jgi:hypothetical protein
MTPYVTTPTATGLKAIELWLAGLVVALLLISAGFVAWSGAVPDYERELSSITTIEQVPANPFDIYP